MSNEQELEIKQLKSDVAKLIQEVDKLNKKVSVLPPSVIHHSEKPRSGDDFFFHGEGHFID